MSIIHLGRSALQSFIFGIWGRPGRPKSYFTDGRPSVYIHIFPKTNISDPRSPLSAVHWKYTIFQIGFPIEQSKTLLEQFGTMSYIDIKWDYIQMFALAWPCTCLAEVFISVPPSILLSWPTFDICQKCQFPQGIGTITFSHFWAWNVKKPF